VRWFLSFHPSIDPKNLNFQKSKNCYLIIRFKSILCDFLRFFPTNQIRHRQKTGWDLEYVSLAYDILCKWFPFYPLHHYEFGPTKFFPKTFKFSIIFYSTWQIWGEAIVEKHADPGKKNHNSRKLREYIRNLLEALLRSRKEENLYGHCDMNNARRILSKGSTLLRGCWVWSKKNHFQKIFGRNFMIAVEEVRYSGEAESKHSATV